MRWPWWNKEMKELAVLFNAVVDPDMATNCCCHGILFHAASYIIALARDNQNRPHGFVVHNFDTQNWKPSEEVENAFAALERLCLATLHTNEESDTYRGISLSRPSRRPPAASLFLEEAFRILATPRQTQQQQQQRLSRQSSGIRGWFGL
jgi:hypothetical protein